MIERSSGILLHVTSLPSEYGIGDLGLNAYEFVNLLARSGQRVWQVLPLNPINGALGYSPYSSSSAFAGNRYLVSPELLIEDGYILPTDLEPMPDFPEGTVAYDQVTDYKERLFDIAWQSFKARSDRSEYDGFNKRETHWLEDYALYQAAKHLHHSKPWDQWQPDIRDREPEALKKLASEQSDRISKIKFEQFVFWQQWYRLKKFANDRGVQLFGDLPIYVNYDSADCWANRELFKLGSDHRPTVVAGVPPDYFSKTGQLWGNPVYDWDQLASTNFEWWMTRLRHLFESFDIVRIDHFRGLVAYWEVPAGDLTAENGQWVDAPAEAFLDAVVEQFKDPALIAEDLGTITDDVVEILEKFGFPGMKILQFAFDSDDPNHRYLPENFDENAVVYTGTHDNNTIVGWFRQEADEATKARLVNYLEKNITENDVHWKFVEMAAKSRARLAVVPIQDVLGLDETARMNTPATAKGNWRWRLTPEQFASIPAKQLADLAQTYDRIV